MDLNFFSIILPQILVEAGNLALSFYGKSREELGIPDKNGTPLTAADKAVHEFFKNRLPKDIPLVSEEGVAEEELHTLVLPEGYCFVIDPIDATKAFIEANGKSFAIHLAVCKNGQPIAGYAYDPLQRTLYWGYCEERRKKIAQVRVWRDKLGDWQQIRPLGNTLSPTAQKVGLQAYRRGHAEELMASGLPQPDVVFVGKTDAHSSEGIETAPGILAASMFDGNRQCRRLYLVCNGGGSIWDVLPVAAIVKAAGGDMRALYGGGNVVPVKGTACPYYVINVDGTRRVLLPTAVAYTIVTVGIAKKFEKDFRKLAMSDATRSELASLLRDMEDTQLLLTLLDRETGEVRAKIAELYAQLCVNLLTF